MKSVLIIGLGRFGRHMARKFIEDGNSVLAVEKSQERADNAVGFINDIQIADATDENYIRSLGVSDFDLCVVAIGDNFQSSLEITVLLKDFGAKRILARASREVHRKLLLRNGADDVVYAEREMAERLAVRYGCDNIFEYFEIGDKTAIVEISVPESWVGKSILQKSVRNKYNINIVAVKRNGEICSNPSPEHIFNADETLVVLSSEKDIERLFR